MAGSSGAQLRDHIERHVEAPSGRQAGRRAGGRSAALVLRQKTVHSRALRAGVSWNSREAVSPTTTSRFYLRELAESQMMHKETLFVQLLNGSNCHRTCHSDGTAKVAAQFHENVPFIVVRDMEVLSRTAPSLSDMRGQRKLE